MHDPDYPFLVPFAHAHHTLYTRLQSDVRCSAFCTLPGGSTDITRSPGKSQTQPKSGCSSIQCLVSMPHARIPC
jgi:hypothetical protein